jgi:hypothetical protein
MAQLVPVMCDEVVPGDVMDLKQAAIIRFAPMLAPLMHRVKVQMYTFFVPYRILFDDGPTGGTAWTAGAVSPTDPLRTGRVNWENFISKGTSGDEVIVLPTTDPAVRGANATPVATAAQVVAEGTLWDYLGFPTGVVPHSTNRPLDFPFRAYYLIWNEWFRNETLQDWVDTTYNGGEYLLKNKNWEKDYFTSALESQQRGTSVGIALAGSAHVDFNLNFTTGAFTTDRFMRAEGSSNNFTQLGTADSGGTTDTNSQALTNFSENFSAYNTLDFSNLTAGDISDLRLASQIQVWQERNNRSGVRYTEFLRGHFDVSPRDDRLQRPEYIGGSSNDVMISEVLQTSEDGTTPQGNMAGHGISVRE